MGLRILAAGLLLIATLAARAEDTDAAREIGAQFEAIVQALNAGDAGPAVARAAAADATFTDIVGRTGPVSGWAARGKYLLAAVTMPVVAIGTQAVTVKGETATAFLRAKVTGAGKDRLGVEGPLVMTVTYRTQWVKEGGAWKLKSAREVMFDGSANKRPIAYSRSAAEEEVRKQFQQLYSAVSELYEKGNFDDLEKGLPADFVAHDADGAAMDKKELIARVRAGAKVVSNAIANLDAQQVSLDGDRAYVVRVMKLFGDVTLPGGKAGRLQYIQVARDTYVKGEKAWVAKSSDELYAEASLNSMPIPLTAISGR